jgi:hypothetical protein
MTKIFAQVYFYLSFYSKKASGDKVSGAMKNIIERGSVSA